MKTILCTLMFLISSISYADTLKGGYPLCPSEKMLRQFVTSAINKDSSSVNLLRRAGCLFMSEKQQRVISVIESDEYVAKIRLGSLIYFTHIQNIVRDDLEAKPYGHDRFVISKALNSDEVNVSVRKPKHKSASQTIRDHNKKVAELLQNIPEA